MARRIQHEQSGFTLIEVMVASLIMVIGVFALVTLADGAASATARTAAREGGTSLARELVETSRAVPYRNLTPTLLRTALESRANLADSTPGGAYTIKRRGVTYTITLEACALDDPKDFYGDHAIDATFCPGQTTSGGVDKNADDARRVGVRVSWRSGGAAASNRQSTVVNNPVGGLGPSVTSLTMRTLVSPLTNPLLETATFDIVTSQVPSRVEWSIDGKKMGEATGSGTSWHFNWPLLSAVGGSVLVRDGTYIVQARAFDSYGRAGAAKPLTINLNRFPPAVVTGFAGGRNGTGTEVDLEWDPNPEKDIVGYRVYRSLTSTVTDSGTPVCETQVTESAAAATSCVDTSAPALGLLSYYSVAAVDRAPNGAYRNSTLASPILIPAETVLTPQPAPTRPTGLSICQGGTSGCDLPSGQVAPVGTKVLTWTKSTDSPSPPDSVASYRVYRDGTANTNRYARVYPPSDPDHTTVSWTETEAAGATHTYRVTAVDNKYKESSKADPWPSVSG
ncbi:MAG: prepilin-type N-terminal cleavage/methylation domain-containing protein [Thermoleophilaceae bacterium]|nr:prepilin-type N-terminal cleavage/methylation domain-containing protein [Thermoleophilaceae bacterium]